MPAMIDRSVLANPSLWLEPEHDGRHALRDAPLTRESIPYILSLPEAGIGAFFYTWVDRLNVAGFACAIFGPGVENGPIVARIDGVTVPADQNFDNWSIAGFNLKQDLKLDKATLSWKGERAAVELAFEATHPAYAYGSDPRGCWSFMADNRLEQSGTARGSITIDGRVIPVDTTCHRDHSWGTRDWEYAQHWKWLVTQSGKDAAVHVFQMYQRGRIDLRGYVFKDGRMSEVVGFDCDFELDETLRQKSLAATVTDAIGRKTTIDAKAVAVQLLPPEPSTCLYEAPLSLTIDGKPGVGWVEFMWPAAYVEHAKAIAGKI
jgi:hypothetical protein